MQDDTLRGSRRAFLATAMAGGAALALGRAASAAEAYPVRPVTVVVPYAPGGNLDITGRAITTAMGAILHASFVIDNRPGAGGVVGHDLVARAQPDGYTLIVTANGSFAYAPRLVPGGKSFKPADFAPVGFMAETPLVLEVPTRGRYATYQDFIAAAKAAPGKISIGHSGNGTTNHIAILLLEKAAGVRLNIIPYKGSGPGLNDLLGGQLDAFIDQLPSSLPHLKAGNLRPLAMTSASRAADLPQVRTLQELGLAGFDVTTTAGLMAPAGTPAAVVARLNQVLNQALGQDDVKQKMANLGSRVRQGSAAEFTAYLASEDKKGQQLASEGLLRAG
ncbi:tripartite tricarboxylate transporter substrate binding protein [Achromobacter aloeverae]|uniref:Tripartite tricarboxylate transporter substrate binding protein n=1 Tax=Achromobacter aloeverae TaxID=1750518 RepID=A0A4Q1HPS0_9BURK|nr:tripartite tricarboxylate transporter substrate binding protein [Achromobacter aloeverae]RXN92366.1 tripartite tricarboxylate transporter substrate binding protein [Achromobacter aloeverae]